MANTDFIKEKLKKWGYIIEECRNRQREIDSLRSLCRTSIRQGEENSSTIKLYNANISRLSNEIESLMSEKTALDKTISSLTTIEKRILILRYMDKKSWDYINAMTGYSRRQCFRIHNDGILHIYNLNCK